MYGMGRRIIRPGSNPAPGGMGDGLDWDSIINTAISTAGKTISALESPTAIGYGGYPIGTGVTAASGGMSLTTVALLGVGIFFLLKVMKR
jgi:hypothetical protein